VLHDIQEISLSFLSPQNPPESQPTQDYVITDANHAQSEASSISDDIDESDFHAQMQRLEREFVEKGKSNPNTPRGAIAESSDTPRSLAESSDTPRSLATSSDSGTVEDGYVRQQVYKIEEIDVKEKKARRRSRTGSDARLSMMIKRTSEMEQQFNTYIAALTESLDKNEKTLDTVQDLLYTMIKRIDEGELDVKGARRYAKKALDVILAEAKQNNE